MKLKIENIGKIKRASVELCGITVIAGENNTGKSTVGKVLYSIFNGFYKMEKQITKERVDSIEQVLSRINHDISFEFNRKISIEDIARKIVENRSQYISNKALLEEHTLDLIVQYDSSFEDHIEKDVFKEALNRIMEIIRISDDDICKIVLSKKMQSEFNEQINNLFTEAEAKIELEIKGNVAEIIVKDNSVTNISNKLQLNTEIIYIDDPFVLDSPETPVFYFVNHTRLMDHRSHLKSKLFFTSKENNIINEIIATNKLDSIYKKINTICNGEIVKDKPRNFGYKKLGSDKVLNFNNISTGLKTFIILKTLLQTGALEDNGVIILDEPEIHLHPEWQLLFAELIVLIQKEFHMHILLNTHSPYFLNAIEVYSAKYKIAHKCKYYIAKEQEDVSVIEDVSNNIEVIYSKLARPLQDLENERYDND